MSFQAMSWAVGMKLPTRDKFVLLMLANYASNEAGDCYPSIARLCDDTSMSKHTVIEALKALEAAGMLTIVRRQQDGVNLPNVYRLHVGRGSAADAPPVQQQDRGSANDALGVVRQLHPNLSDEPINEPKKKNIGEVRFDGCTLTVTEQAIAGFAQAYPRIDVRAEIAKASSWLAHNPTRRPKSAFGRFLNAWLARAAARPTNARQTQLEQRQAFMEAIFSRHTGAVDDTLTIDHAT